MNYDDVGYGAPSGPPQPAQAGYPAPAGQPGVYPNLPGSESAPGKTAGHGAVPPIQQQMASMTINPQQAAGYKVSKSFLNC